MEVTTSHDFKKQTEYFLDKTYEAERLKLYTERSAQDGTPLNKAKLSILSERFGAYIRLSFDEAKAAAAGEDVSKAKQIVDEIYLLKRVFKSHDLLTINDFLVSEIPESNKAIFNLVYNAPTVTADEVDKLSEVVRFCLKNNEKRSLANSTEELIVQILNHPLFECYSICYKNAQQKIDILEAASPCDNIFHNMATSIARLRLKGKQENYDALISHIINLDVTIGLAEVLTDRDFDPQALRDLLISLCRTPLPDGVDSLIETAAESINSTLDTSIHFNMEKTGQDKIACIDTSTQSLCDSGTIFHIDSDAHSTKEDNVRSGVIMLIHTASKDGCDQDKQQSVAVYNANNHIVGYNWDQFKTNTTANYRITDLISATIVDYGISGYKSNRHELRGNQEIRKCGKNLSDTDICFLSSINTLSAMTSVGMADKTDFSSSRILSKNCLLIRDSLNDSKKLWLSYLKKTDAEILKDALERVVTILEQNGQLMTLITGQSTHKGVDNIRLAKPILELFKNISEIDWHETSLSKKPISSPALRSRITVLLSENESAMNDPINKTCIISTLHNFQSLSAREKKRNKNNKKMVYKRIGN